MSGTSKTPQSKSPILRKPYAPPRLVSYGHVKDIVQGNTGMMGDLGTTRMCWVAEALYGVADPRTLALRGWLSTVYAQRRRGWPLIEVYRQFGPTLAHLITSGRVPGPALLPLFDFLVGRAFDAWAHAIKDERHCRKV